MAKAAETPPDTLLDKDTARRLFRMMALIRRFEERTEEQYTRARIGGYCHLAIGEEASTVGAIDALERRATACYASYRDHGTALAVGSEPVGRDGRAVRQGDRRRPRPRRLDAPAGRAAPLLRRLGHRRRPPADRRRRGAGARPTATCRNAVLCQFGDGAVETGAFHEALNLAGIWDLPIVFQVINNQYGMGTSVEPVLGRARALAARRRLPHARRAGRRQRRAGRPRGDRAADGDRPPGTPPGPAGDASPTASAATAWPTPARSTARPRRSTRGASATRSPASGCSAASAGCSSRTRSTRSGATSPPRSRRPSTRRSSAAFPDPDTLYEHVYGDPAWREQFSRMRAGAPFGERGEERTWQT